MRTTLRIELIDIIRKKRDEAVKTGVDDWVYWRSNLEEALLRTYKKQGVTLRGLRECFNMAEGYSKEQTALQNEQNSTI